MIRNDSDRCTSFSSALLLLRHSQLVSSEASYSIITMAHFQFWSHARSTALNRVTVRVQ